MIDWFSILKLFILPGVVALGVSWLTTPLVVKMVMKLGFVDDPKFKRDKNTHSYPVPRGGGLPIFLALLVGVWLFLPLDQHVWGISLGALVVLVVGLVDDRWNLSPYIRLFGGNVLAALMVVGAGIGIAFITNPFGPLAPDGAGQAVIDLSVWKFDFSLLGEMRSIWILADAFAILWIVGLMNVVGQGAGGVEGQFPGVVAIGAITIGILSLGFSADIAQWPVITLAGITAGAYLGFLPWNFYPQKIMPGYSGKSLGGFLLAVMAILSTAKVGTALVVLGVPIMDASWAVVRRVMKRKSPVWGDRGHLHHRLLDSGWTKRQVAVFYWGVTGLLGVLALSMNSGQKVYIIVALGVLVGIGLLGLGELLKKEN